MAKTLASLIADVRTRCDITNSQFVTDSEITSLLSAGLMELWDEVTNVCEDYQVTSAVLTISGSDPAARTNYFTLPADFLKSRGVSRQFGGYWQTLWPASVNERNQWAWPAWPNSYGIVSLKYRLQGDRCYVYPAQAADGTYELLYVPFCVQLANPSDELPSFLGSTGWWEFMVSDACAKILQKQDLDASVFLQQKESQRTRVIKSASPRDAGPPRKTVDTRSRSMLPGMGGYGNGGSL